MPLGEITWKTQKRTAIKLNDTRGDGVKKASVVCDHNGAARPLFERAFQPLDAIEVKMVGGLVQQQQARLIGHGTDECHAFTHAARECAHNGFGREAELVDQCAYARGTIPVFAFWIIFAEHGLLDRQCFIELWLLFDGCDVDVACDVDRTIIRLCAAVK